jgi:hypothetical protein
MPGTFGENAFEAVVVGASGSVRLMYPSPERVAVCVVFMSFIRAQSSRWVCKSLCMLLIYQGEIVVTGKNRAGEMSNNDVERGAMQVIVEIPDDLGRRIAADPGELSRVALEGLALEGVRYGSAYGY